MNNIFHNTIPLEGESLKKHLERATAQDARIYRFFEINGHKNWTPCEVEAQFNSNGNDNKILLTSIRRAINNLTRDGFLLKLENIKRIGKHGSPVNVWEFKKDYQNEIQQELFTLKEK